MGTMKKNFSQAFSELVGISKTVEPENINDESNPIQSQARQDEEGSAAIGNIDKEVAIIEKNSMPIDNNTTINQQEADKESQESQNPKEKILAMLAQQKQSAQDDNKDKDKDKDKESYVTTIARGTVINGEINTNGDVDLLGSVKGKVTANGDIKANGKVIGDLLGKDITLTSCGVQGNIIASGFVTIDEDSVVIGDVTCKNFCLDGKIKGNVTVEQEAKFKPKAILAGNVSTAMIAMSHGAKIQGEVNIPLTEKDAEMSFDID